MVGLEFVWGWAFLWDCRGCAGGLAAAAGNGWEEVGEFGALHLGVWVFVFEGDFQPEIGVAEDVGEAGLMAVWGGGVDFGDAGLHGGKEVAHLVPLCEMNLR